MIFFSALLMTRLQYKMHSEVFIISGLVDFLLCSSFHPLLLLDLFSCTPAFLPGIVIYIFSLGMSVLVGLFSSTSGDDLAPYLFSNFFFFNQ